MNSEQLEFVKKSLNDDSKEVLRYNSNISLLIVLQALFLIVIFILPSSIMFSVLFLLNLFLIHKSVIGLKWAIKTFNVGIRLFESVGIDIYTEPFEDAKSKIEKAPISWSFLINLLP